MQKLLSAQEAAHLQGTRSLKKQLSALQSRVQRLASKRNGNAWHPTAPEREACGRIPSSEPRTGPGCRPHPHPCPSVCPQRPVRSWQCPRTGGSWAGAHGWATTFTSSATLVFGWWARRHGPAGVTAPGAAPSPPAEVKWRGLGDGSSIALLPATGLRRGCVPAGPGGRKGQGSASPAPQPWSRGIYQLLLPRY